MKKTKYIKTIEKEYFKFRQYKFMLWLQMKFFISKNRRKSSRIILENIGIMEALKSSQINSLPDNIYYKPTDILIYDLIQKQDLDKLKKGINSLFKNNLSHKFITPVTLQRDISKMIDDLDHMINSSKSWWHVGIFDFANNVEIDGYIHHFQICLRNFSSSYIAVEIIITLADAFRDEIGDFVSRDYKKPGMCIYKMWEKNAKKSGGKVSYSIGRGILNTHAKNILINEQLQYVKKLFLRYISRFLPIIQYSKGMELYSINAFETNIDFEKEIPNSVGIFQSLGLDDLYGFFLSDAERLYSCSSVLGVSERYCSDMLFVFNPEKIKEHAGCTSPKNKALYNLTQNYMMSLYTMVIIKNLSINYSRMISEFRNRENVMKTTRRSHKKLLKLKYEIERVYYSYSKIDHEFSVENEVKSINKLLKENDFVRKSKVNGYYPHEVFTNVPQNLWKLIKINYNELMIDLNNKIEISSSLNNYYDAKKNSRVSWIQLVIAVCTFILLIFPEKAMVVAEFLLYWCGAAKDLIYSFLK